MTDNRTDGGPTEDERTKPGNTGTNPAGKSAEEPAERAVDAARTARSPQG